VGHVTLVLGGTRSGKSEFAERQVLDLEGPLLYLATGTVDAGDDDMAGRVAHHRERRDGRFTTIEAGAGLVEALTDAPNRPALVDALGTWVAAMPDFADSDRVQVEAEQLVEVLRRRAAPTVLVSDEVGMGVHPSTEVGRLFRDALGLVNQIVARAADRAWLVVAGRALPL
jgi:adenosyl cobinamide kinase/adenosyl cobinamide phosphate guanylyltransferase